MTLIQTATKVIQARLSKWYTHAGLVFGCTLGANVFLAIMLWQLSDITTPLLPQPLGNVHWKPALQSDQGYGGNSQIVLIGNDPPEFQFTLGSGIQYPYISYIFKFAGWPEDTIDLSGYDTVVLKIKCTPKNVMALELYSHDDAVTKPNDFTTLRVSRAYFICSEQWSTVNIDIADLEVQEWWLSQHHLDFSDRRYRLDKVAGIAINNTVQSPINTLSTATIQQATLKGRHQYFVYITGIVSCFTWFTLILWFVRRRTARLIEDLIQRSQQNLPVIAYQQVSTSPVQDREKSSVLQYMSQKYTDPDLNLEAVASELGINRTKINEILKDELELTFSSYVTTLRLQEAARLLIENKISVGEIAFLVGYNNASYFTTVFRKEYGCTPKAYRRLMTPSDR